MAWRCADALGARVAYESLSGRMADDMEIWAAQLDRELLAETADGRR